MNWCDRVPPEEWFNLGIVVCYSNEGLPCNRDNQILTIKTFEKSSGKGEPAMSRRDTCWSYEGIQSHPEGLILLRMKSKEVVRQGQPDCSVISVQKEKNNNDHSWKERQLQFIKGHGTARTDFQTPAICLYDPYHVGPGSRGVARTTYQRLESLEKCPMTAVAENPSENRKDLTEPYRSIAR